jgi:PAS domain S-box-containing protein
MSSQDETETHLKEAYKQIQIQAEELHLSNEKLYKTGFRTLAENSPDLITRFDRQNFCLYANPAAMEFNAIIDPHMTGILEKHRTNVFTSGKPESAEFHYVSPQGKDYYFDTKIAPEFINGEISSVLVISRDITALKEYEAKLNETLGNLEKLVKVRTDELEEAYNLLKESEKGLAEAQKMAHIGNWNWNLVNNKFYFSDELYRIFGLNPQELDVSSLEEVFAYIHPEDRDYVTNSIFEALNGKVYDAIDFRIILADGTYRTVYTQGEATFDEKNIPVQLRGTIQDITERKKMDEALRESEQKYRNIVEIANEGILVIDDKLTITYYNRKLSEMLGYDSEEGIGRQIWDYVKEESKVAVKYNMEKRLQGINEPYELELICKDNSFIWVLLNSKSLFNKNGKFAGSLSMLTDITEKKIAEKLLHEKQIAEVANRTKSEFLAKISHELRTPLNSIIGFSDLLYEQAYGDLNKRQLKSVENISKSGKHLLNLINDILDLSKIEAGKLNLEYKCFELVPKLNLIQNLMSPIADRKNIKIEIDVDSTLKNICADEDRFAQVMYNLVDNAIKFSYENSLVKIVGRKKGEMMEIAINDTGIGIKAEDQKKLFKPFSQVDYFSSKRYQGTGLGLSLVKQIVHLHNGYVWFKSHPGEGSTFAFAIPINYKKESVN